MCREVAAWAKEDIISREQAESICTRYGVDYHNMSRRSLGYNVLMGFGCLFIGLALITLIGENWDEIPRALRMYSLITLTLAANIFGLLKYRNNRTSQSVLFFFLGSLFYGASIILIAQIYHIGEHFPDGIFWWAIGVLPAALLLESSLIMILALCLGFIWFFAESSLNYYPALFPVFPAAAFLHLYRGKKSSIIFFALIAGSAVWAEYTLAWFADERKGFYPGAENVALGIGIFILFHGLSKWLDEKEDHSLSEYGTLLGLWVLRFIIITMFIFSFKQPWRELIEAQWNLGGIVIALSVLLSALSLWLTFLSGKPLFSTLVFIAVYIAGLLSVILIKDRVYEIVFQFAENILLVGVGVYLIIEGIRKNASHYFYAGVLAVLATGLLRYIDLIGDYIGASILFAALAAVLIFSARYWKKHQAETMGAS